MSTGDNYLKWKQRAEQAENELRALKLSHERLRKECMDAEARAERAEADNAAKDRAFSEYVAAWGVDHEDLPGTDTPCPEDDACECPHVVALNAAFGSKHPGAALLERLRALESRLTMASAELRHAYKVKQDWELVARAIRMLEAVTTPGGADSLKEHKS